MALDHKLITTKRNGSRHFAHITEISFDGMGVNQTHSARMDVRVNVGLRSARTGQKERNLALRMEIPEALSFIWTTRACQWG